MSYQVIDPFLEFTNLANGQPIGTGSVYFGRPDSDPKNQPSNRINVYAVQDNGTEVLLSQPIQLNAAGQPQYNGSPKQLKIELAGSDTSYCVQVLDKNGAQKLYTARVVPAVDVVSLGASNSTVPIGGVAAGIVAKHVSGFVTPEDFGAVGNGVNNDTAAWQAAAATGFEIRCPSEKSYMVSQQITLLSGTLVNLSTSSITQMTDQTPIFNIENKTGITIINGVFNGKAEASYVNSSSSNAVAIIATNATNVVVENNSFNGFYYSPLKCLVGGMNIRFNNNNVVGIPLVLAADPNRRNTTGVTIIGTNTQIKGNSITGTASGIIVGEGSVNAIVSENIIYSMVNEHGIYADTGIRRLAITNNIIFGTGTFGNGIKVQFYDAFGVQPSATNISDNVLFNTGTDGILVNNTTAGTPTIRLVGLVISDNVIIDSGANGLNVRFTEDATVNGNTVINCYSAGIQYGASQRIKIHDNKVRGAGTSGIRDVVSLSDFVSIKDNEIYNVATRNLAGDEFGILQALNSTNVDVEGNRISDQNSNMQYGVFLQPATNANVKLSGNRATGATDTGIRTIATDSFMEYRDNEFSGAIGVAVASTAAKVVASAATITLPQLCEVVSITGTTNIDNISAVGRTNSRVTLVFSAALTVSVAGNIKLNGGAFAAAANKSLTLVCDGVNWYG